MQYNMSQSDDSMLLLETLLRESDRGMLLVGCSFLDESLAKLHAAYIKFNTSDKKLIEKLNKPFAPLNSFSGKITLARAYGLIKNKVQD